MINILSLCDEPEILKVFRLVKIALNIIRVAGPILLIVSLSLAYASAVASNDQDMVKKATMDGVKKIIAAILIFFVPSFVNIVFSLVTDDETYKTCLQNATIENIETAYNLRSQYLMNEARDKKTYSAYMQALMSLKHISDGNVKAEYEKELAEIKKIIDVKNLVEKVKRTKRMSDYKAAMEAVEDIDDDEVREELESELEQIAATMQSAFSGYSSPGQVENLLGIPYYNQCDQRWGNINYDTGGATFCSSSCGYTSLAMIVAGLSRSTTVTPVTMVEQINGISLASGEKTHKGYGAASTGDLTNASVLSRYGITATTIPATIDSVMDAINSNKPVIILAPGHYIVVVPSLDGAGVTLLDPFSGGWGNPMKVSGTYSLEQIYNAYDGFNWAAAYSN